MSGGSRCARMTCHSSHSSSVASRLLAAVAASSGASAGSVRFTAAGCTRSGSTERVPPVSAVTQGSCRI